MHLLSVVVPCYNEETSVPLFVDELGAVMRAWSKAPAVELVLIDDGSRDGTLEACKGAALRDDLPFSVRWISFSRNFGKEAGLLAGMRAARGDLVATMDVDLQDPPSLLPEMCAALEGDASLDSVATRRVTRKGEPPVRSWFARMFYRVINRISDTEIVDGARDYRLMRRVMVDAVLSLHERNRFSKGIFSWVGFRTMWIEYENRERSAGESHWSFWSLLLYAIDGITAFSTAPLAAASLTGVALCLVALVAVAVIVVKTVMFGDPVSGWPSLACIITFIGGLQLLCLGVMGQYLAKTYLEAKRRPCYIVRESSDGDLPGEGRGRDDR